MQKHFRKKDVFNDNITDSKLYKFKASIARRTPAGSNKKRCWNNCVIKILEQFLGDSWNAFDQFWNKNHINLVRKLHHHKSNRRRSIQNNKNKTVPSSGNSTTVYSTQYKVTTTIEMRIQTKNRLTVSTNSITTKTKPVLSLLSWSTFSRYQPTLRESFANKADITGHTEHFLTKVEIRDSNVMTDGWNFFNQPVKNDITTYENVKKVVAIKIDNYTTGSLLDYPFFRENCKLIAIIWANNKNSMLIQKPYHKLFLQ